MVLGLIGGWLLGRSPDEEEPAGGTGNDGGRQFDASLMNPGGPPHVTRPPG